MTFDLDSCLQKSFEQPYNRICADCESKAVRFLSVTFGVFLCARCADSHRKLDSDVRRATSYDEVKEFVDISTIKSFLDKGGNAKLNAQLEAELPAYFRRPWDSDNCPDFLREDFIKSKYIHEEFSKGALARNAQCRFSAPMKSGILLKKLRDADAFCERFFELSVERNYLKYYVKSCDPEPKNSLDLEKLNITFINPTKFDAPAHTALVQFVQDGSTRHMFIRSEDSRTIISWYNSIRMGKFSRICINLTCMGLSYSQSEVAHTLTRDIDMAGWLSKTGPRKTDVWRKRWCMLFQRHLLYTDKPLSAFAKGEIFIGSQNDGFFITDGAPSNWKRRNGFAFTINTPDRPFVFVSDSLDEKESWILALERVTQIPITLEESKRVAHVALKHASIYA
ncbi:unnamed protein product [Dicrocoelium dendriticum]|nr:unnamed protein product [Dicrocoelium dendriticum]